MTTGEYLKQKRADLNMSLAEVAGAIGLDEKLLGEIEEEKATHVAQVYRNGYIRTYARYLKIPENEIRNLVSLDQNDHPPIHNIFPEPQNQNHVEKWLRATSYVLASLLIGTLAWQFTHEAVRLSQSGSRLTSQTEVSTESADQATPGQAKTLNGPVNASIASLGALHKGQADGLDTAEQAWEALAHPELPEALPEGESRLQLSVSADSWVEITDDKGQELEMDLLRAGTDKSYHGKPPFRILLGQARAVRLTIDGEQIDLTGFTRENVAQLTWPQTKHADGIGIDRN